ncbi:MAG: DMT family protein [Planctomycetes bacterium]|nr:DMT family protein [Planctomycetota bacterium]
MNTILLLIASNVFMTMAWYGHLKYAQHNLWKVVMVSWLIALPEYCLQVPANRWGRGAFTLYQLKTLQEIITLLVFMLFALLYFGETPRWNHLASFALIVAAVYFAFLR